MCEGVHVFMYIVEENKQLSSVSMGTEVKNIPRLLYIDLDSL